MCWFLPPTGMIDLHGKAVYSEHVSPRSQIYDGANMRRGQRKKTEKSKSGDTEMQTVGWSRINISTNTKPLESSVIISTRYPCCCSLCWDILPVVGRLGVKHLFAFIFQVSGSLLVWKYRLIKQVGVGVGIWTVLTLHLEHPMVTLNITGLSAVFNNWFNLNTLFSKLSNVVTRETGLEYQYSYWKILQCIINFQYQNPVSG